MLAGSSNGAFLCSVCRSVFNDPVTIPCGHNFCKTCITQHWKINIQCQCPSCKDVFYPKPELRVNTLISEMVAQQKASSTRVTAAVIICLVLCVCFPLCYMTHDAKEHPKTEEHEEKKAELLKADPEIQHLIKMGRVTIERVKSSVESNEDDTLRIEDGLRDLKDTQAEFFYTIEEKVRNIINQSKGFVNDLKQVTSELEMMHSRAVGRSLLGYISSFFYFNWPSPRRSQTQGVTSEDL